MVDLVDLIEPLGIQDFQDVIDVMGVPEPDEMFPCYNIPRWEAETMSFRIAYTDITQLKVDAIVNPTDRFYSGGGGVDRLIHGLCGPRLREATDALPLLHLGDAKATPGFALPCKYIIHTSGPRWKESHFLEVSLLGSCYRNSVQLAYNLGCRSIAFPLISSRGKHFPKEQALTTAVNAILECLDEYPDMEIILAIYGKWAENMPASFFERLTEYIYNTYLPEEQSEEEQPEEEQLEEEYCLQDSMLMAAEETIRIGEVEKKGRSIIRDLMDNPTQKNLDKVELDESFAQMLNRLIKERKTRTNDLLNAVGLSGAGISKIRNGKTNPSKLTVFALAIFFHLSIEETEEMLMKAGYAFNPSSMQDIIVSGLIREGIYDRYQIDDLLYALDLQVLPGAVI